MLDKGRGSDRPASQAANKEAVKMRTANRIRRSIFIVAGFVFGFILSASAENLLVNGSFEEQPPRGAKPTGWSALSGGWTGYCNDATKAGSLFKYSATQNTTSGNYWIRKDCVLSVSPMTANFFTVAYKVSDLPSGTKQLKLDLKSVASSANADAGNYQTYGTLCFYASEDGFETVKSYETARLTCTGGYASTNWTAVSGTFSIPEGAVSYKVAATLEILKATSASIYPRFDDFNLSAVSE